MRQLILVVFLLCSSVALAQDTQPEPPHIPFQGQIRNFAGELLPDSSLFMAFRIYSDSIGGEPLWSESHPLVAVRNGLFNANLGSINPCSLSLFSGRPIFLETQIGDDALPLGHRIRVGSAPSSGSSQRVSGDVYTGPGSIRMFAPQPEPPRDPLLSMETTIGNEASIYMFAPQPEPPRPDPYKVVSINSTPSNGGSIRMFAPQPEPPRDPVLEMASGPDGEASIYMFAPQPEPPRPDPYRILTINSSPSDGGSIKMFAPQPEPPHDPTLEMRTSPDGEASFGMFAVKSDLMKQLFGVKTDLTRSEMEFSAPQMEGVELVNNNPQIKISCDSTISRVLVQRSRDVLGGPTDSTGIIMQADSLQSSLKLFSSNFEQFRASTFASGGALDIFNQGTEYMRIWPNQNGGGELKLFDSGGTAQVTLSSYGRLSIGTTNASNIITVNPLSNTDPIAHAWTTYSSRRWKTNIQPIQNALDKVMRLNGVTYDWIENGKHDIGLIAEDVGQVVPEVVAYEENGVDAKSVDYARLTALLIEAVKDQQKTIEQLKADITELKNKEAAK